MRHLSFLAIAIATGLQAIDLVGSVVWPDALSAHGGSAPFWVRILYYGVQIPSIFAIDKLSLPVEDVSRGMYLLITSVIDILFWSLGVLLLLLVFRRVRGLTSAWSRRGV